ncbi:MAG: hypothetical protein RML32_02845 [Gammaproteobacteria bacterium]|nr:hypothetical protein [Gammaproteobacteria bacterium]
MAESERQLPPNCNVGDVNGHVKSARLRYIGETLSLQFGECGPLLVHAWPHDGIVSICTWANCKTTVEKARDACKRLGIDFEYVKPQRVIEP